MRHSSQDRTHHELRELTSLFGIDPRYLRYFEMNPDASLSLRHVGAVGLRFQYDTDGSRAARWIVPQAMDAPVITHYPRR